MEKLSPKHMARSKEAAAQIFDVAKSLPLLRSVNWDDGLRIKFLASGTLPAPEYLTVDTSGATDAIASARAKLDGDHVLTQWLGRLCDTQIWISTSLLSKGIKNF